MVCYLTSEITLETLKILRGASAHDLGVGDLENKPVFLNLKWLRTFSRVSFHSKTYQNNLIVCRRCASLFPDFYIQICLFTSAESVQNNNFLVSNGLFICLFKIFSQKWHDLSTANNEGNIYCVAFD
jgi:hypothetical protein